MGRMVDDASTNIKPQQHYSTCRKHGVLSIGPCPFCEQECTSWLVEMSKWIEKQLEAKDD